MPCLAVGCSPQVDCTLIQTSFLSSAGIHSRGEVPTALGTAESKCPPLRAPSENPNQTAVSPAQGMSKTPPVKVRIEPLSEGGADALSNGFESITATRVGCHRRTKTHLEDLFALVHP